MSGSSKRRDYLLLGHPVRRVCMEHLLGISSHRTDRIGCIDMRFGQHPTKPSGTDSQHWCILLRDVQQHSRTTSWQVGLVVCWHFFFWQFFFMVEIVQIFVQAHSLNVSTTKARSTGARENHRTSMQKWWLWYGSLGPWWSCVFQWIWRQWCWPTSAFEIQFWLHRRYDRHCCLYRHYYILFDLFGLPIFVQGHLQLASSVYWTMCSSHKFFIFEHLWNPKIWGYFATGEEIFAPRHNFWDVPVLRGMVLMHIRLNAKLRNLSMFDFRTFF